MPRADDGTGRTLLDALRDGVIVLDSDGSVVEMNEAFVAMLGYGREGLPYHPPHPWWPDRERHPDEFALLSSVAAAFRTGEPAVMSVPLYHRAGRRLWVECSIADLGGDVAGHGRVVGLARDVTEQHRARQRERLLAETGRLVIGTGELSERLDALVTAIAELFGELVVVWRTGPDGALRAAAAAHPNRPELARSVLTGTGPPVDGSTDRQAGMAPDADGRLRLHAPLEVSGRALGLLTVTATAGEQAFDQADVELAEELARRMAGMLEADRIAVRDRQLREASDALAGACTVGEAAAALAHAVQDALGTFGVVVFTIHPDDPEHMHLEHNLGYPPEFVEKFAVFDVGIHPVTAGLLRSGRPMWLSDRRAWEEHYAYVHRIGWLRRAEAGMVVPLRLGERTLGVLAAAFLTVREFPAEERAFVRTLVGQAAQAFERAALSDARWEIAQTLQQSLLAQRLPTVERLGLAAHYRPAGEHIQAGGDWYDVIALDASRVGIVVGDVVGHGTEAAAIMGHLRAALAAYLLEGHGPARALRLLSQVAARIDGALASTVVCLVLDPRTAELCWSTAGHPPPLLVDPENADEPVRFLTDARGGVLGAGRLGGFAVAHTEARLVLPAGASVVLYTDGLIERPGESPNQGLNRLSRVVAAHTAAHTEAQPAALSRAVLSGVLGDGVPDDDVALVVARLQPTAAEPAPPASTDPGHTAAPAWSDPPDAEPLEELVVRWHPDGALTLRLLGTLDLSTVEPVRAELARCLRASNGPVTIDTAEVTHLGSAGVRLITEAMQIAGDRLRLRVEPGTAVANSLAVSGLDLEASRR